MPSPESGDHRLSSYGPSVLLARDADCSFQMDRRDAQSDQQMTIVAKLGVG
jgi:hypothetical protein